MPRFEGTNKTIIRFYFCRCEPIISHMRSRGHVVMPKLNAATQAARRAHILDAAERCFARAGFHRTSMQDICREAGVSAGALYVYFASKEGLIAGIAERDRSKLAGEFAKLASTPDLATALAKLGEHYAVEEPKHKRLMCVEIGIESTRNEAVGAIHRSVDDFVRQSFEQLFERAVAEGRIQPSLSPKALAEIILVIGDGMFWRRAIDPNFNPKSVIPAITAIVAGLLNSAEPDPPNRTTKVPAQKSDRNEKSGGRKGARS